MARLEITNTRKLTLGGKKVVVRDLRQLLAGVADSAEVSIEVYRGDIREGDTTTLTVNMLNPIHSHGPGPQYPPGVRGGTWQGDVPVDPR